MVGDKHDERFWKSLTPPNYDSELLASCILEELKRRKINDNPSKTRFFFSIQTFIKSDDLNAHYIHCYIHQLSHAIIKVASININVKIFLQTFMIFSSPQSTAITNETVNKYYFDLYPLGGISSQEV